MLEELLERQSLIWRHKLRESLMMDGNRNTRFFHASTLVRHRVNHIRGICDSGGGWLESWVEIGEYFTRNFKNIFTSSNLVIGNQLEELFEDKVSEDVNSELICIPTEEEV